MTTERKASSSKTQSSKQIPLSQKRIREVMPNQRMASQNFQMHQTNSQRTTIPPRPQKKVSQQIGTNKKEELLRLISSKLRNARNLIRSVKPKEEEGDESLCLYYD